MAIHLRRHGNETVTTEVQESGILTLPPFHCRTSLCWLFLSNRIRSCDGSICGKNYGGVITGRWGVVPWRPFAMVEALLVITGNR